MELVYFGKIIKPFGIKGEILARLYDDPLLKEYISKIKYLYIQKEKTNLKFKVRTLKPHKENYIISLEGILNRNQAEELRDFDLFLNPNDILVKKADLNRYFWFEIINARIIDTNGKEIGTVKEIFNNGVYDIFIVKKGEKEYLLPAIRPFLIEINLSEKTIKYDVIDGLLEINDAV